MQFPVEDLSSRAINARSTYGNGIERASGLEYLERLVLDETN
jgi:hypothetical protein